MKREKIRLGGKFHVQHIRKGEVINEFDCDNGIVDVGLNKILDDMFNSGTQSATWYCGLINDSGFTALADADTMASHTGWSELTSYTEANRVTWGVGAAASRSVTNSTTMDFSINATVDVNGIFIVDNNTKNGNTGTLWATASFSSAVSATSGDTLKVTYTVSG